MRHEDLFWLHIKKSAGISTRRLLHPYYIEVDRVNKPKCFIQAKPAEYNDILNNYRVVLGEYQFKRCLFAKKYLYRDRWDSLFSFAFSREPTDRCVSMFFYLFWRDAGVLRSAMRSIKRSVQSGRILYSTASAFDAFLDCVEAARVSDSVYRPLGNHFTTHTAAMWDDITDHEGNVLLTAVFRLENLIGGINTAFERIGVDRRLTDSGNILNSNPGRKPYTPSKRQRQRIERIYARDYDVYEGAQA
jgi:hypothetical protein